MGVMVRTAALSRSVMVLCFSTVILLSSGQRQVSASLPNTQASTIDEGTYQNHLPVQAQPEEINKLPPSVVNPITDTKLVIRLNQRRVYVYRGDRLQGSYQIAIGKTGWETPTGNFKVLQMIQDPAWEHPWTGQVIPPGPNNPLGNRWIAFWTDGKNLIGFHGTPNERLIGQAVSHGCIRMRNQDVMALYEQVSVGTPVVVAR